MNDFDADVAVIGAGPVGLFCVFALGQMGLTSTVIDALPEIGGQCNALYAEKPIYDIPSRVEVSGAQLTSLLREQAKPYEPKYRLGVRAERLSARQGGFDVQLSDGAVVCARTIVIAAGCGAMAPNRPALRGIEQYEGSSVFYSVTAPERFRGQRVVVAGGGDSAADWAVALCSVTAHVSLVHRRQAFRAAISTMADIQRLQAQGQMQVVAPHTLHALLGEGHALNAVQLLGEDGSVSTIPADALLCFFGLAKDLSVFDSWQVGADRSGIPVDRATMSTCRPGVFAAGDIAHYSGKLKLILTGFAEAASAAHAARAHLYPGRNFHFQYSTSVGPPGRTSPQ